MRIISATTCQDAIKDRITAEWFRNDLLRLESDIKEQLKTMRPNGRLRAITFVIRARINTRPFYTVLTKDNIMRRAAAMSRCTCPRQLLDANCRLSPEIIISPHNQRQRGTPCLVILIKEHRCVILLSFSLLLLSITTSKCLLLWFINEQIIIQLKTFANFNNN